MGRISYVPNGLLDIIIHLHKILSGKKFTKREARKVIKNMKIGKKLLETKIEYLPLKKYEEIPKKLSSVLKLRKVK